MVRRVVITGCSGAGKSTVVDALAAKGYATFPEPGRELVSAELSAEGDDLPWANAGGFMKKVVALAKHQWEMASHPVSFYDRSLIDAVTWLERQSAPLPKDVSSLVSDYPYDTTVFSVPPWRDIFVNDAERRHSFDAAVEEYEALLVSYPAKGYTVLNIPKLPVDERASWVLSKVGSA